MTFRRGCKVTPSKSSTVLRTPKTRAFHSRNARAEREHAQEEREKLRGVEAVNTGAQNALAFSTSECTRRNAQLAMRAMQELWVPVCVDHCTATHRPADMVSSRWYRSSTLDKRLKLTSVNTSTAEPILAYVGRRRSDF